jgi:hypothetical protein
MDFVEPCVFVVNVNDTIWRIVVSLLVLRPLPVFVDVTVMTKLFQIDNYMSYRSSTVSPHLNYMASTWL